MNDSILLDPPKPRRKSAKRPVSAEVPPVSPIRRRKSTATPASTSTKPKSKSAAFQAQAAPEATKEEAPESSQIHTSQLLRNLLAQPVNSFTVQNIVESLGGTSAFGTSLMLFSLPEVLPIPIPGISAIVVIPVGVISAQMVAGSGKLKLPNYILKRTIHRKALAPAIHAILPVLERAEKVVKPRWSWILHPAAKRFIGAVVFLLALAIALPVPGTNIPLAISIFIIAMGLAERDGKVVLIGMLLGLASLALLGGIVTGILALINAI